MATFDYKGTLAWDEAMDLVLKLGRLSEELPDQEAEFMGRRLRETGLTLLQDMAGALVAQTKPGDDKLIAVDVALELVGRTYPALDTAAAEAALAVMVQRTQGDFQQRPSLPPPPVPVDEPDEDEPEVATEAALMPTPSVAESLPTTEVPSSSPQVSVPVLQEESGVHPNYGQ